MAKEATIRKKATDKLLDDDWVVCVPTRNRFGSSNTYWIENEEKQRKGTDDLFSIFDLVAWKDDELLFVQYTSRSEVGRRAKKIKKFIKKHNLKITIRIEVWGYENRKGFTKVKKITNYETR